MQWTSIGIDLNNLRFESKVQSANPSSAQRFAQQLPVWLNHLAKWPTGDSTGSDIEKIVQLLSIEAKGDQVIIGVRGLDQLTRGSQLLVDALSKVSTPFKRRAKMDKMKNLLLALHNYYAAMGSFPPNQMVAIQMERLDSAGEYTYSLFLATMNSTRNSS